MCHCWPVKRSALPPASRSLTERLIAKRMLKTDLLSNACHSLEARLALQIKTARLTHRDHWLKQCDVRTAYGLY